MNHQLKGAIFIVISKLIETYSRYSVHFNSMGLNVLDIFRKLKMWCVPLHEEQEPPRTRTRGSSGRAVHIITVTATTYPKYQNLKMSAIVTVPVESRYYT